MTITITIIFQKIYILKDIMAIIFQFKGIKVIMDSIQLKLAKTEKDGIVDQGFRDYMRSVNYSPITKHQYDLKSRRLIKYLTAKQQPRELSQDTINSFLAMMQSNRNPNNMGFIKALMKAYDPRGKLDILIPQTQGRRQREEDKVHHKFLEKEQVDTLIHSITNGHIKLMIKLYTETGLRATELLLWDANNPKCKIDWQKRIIHGVGKYGKTFHQPFSNQTSVWLRAWINEVHRRKHDVKQPFLFYKPNGEPYKNQHGALWKRINKACKKINFPEHVHPHRFRHFVGHYLRVGIGMDLEQIRKYLRHTKLETTQIYSSATDEELYEKMNKEVFK